ncbi:MAG: DUF3536 domain-containing protein [candidate division KSB1 bacterium]|nr:DUF3536 domain-containing protein [candidate division KSB1 bacterium]
MAEEGTRFLIIHAHFYQPPRENPWTGEIMREESAAPYHDWNERILRECYRPNSASRILDGRGRVLDIVNNYRRISFNFGPTLAQWLQAQAPEVYNRVLEADRQSLALNNGHGNAIAQAYNHMILPLANERDLQTQIVWGLADFRHRFGREPEAMWLPETAVSRRVLEALAEHGMKYVILSPFQARRIRKLDGRGRWIDVAGGRVDSRRPYRWRGSGGREIDVLFYHGDLSQQVSFGDLLTNAGRLANAIMAAYSETGKRDQLVLIATDGETYGHHKPFGDMALAYLLEMEVPRMRVQLVNPAAYLERCRPEWEVEIDEGPDGLGSSWSCAHGVGRWFRDCGCSTGGKPGWHQRWRGPLRQALDFLRDELARIFEEHGEPIFGDPWRARDGYISVVLDRSPDSVQRFLAEYAPGAKTRDQQVQALKLLEMQRQAMLMYTSCGWFFADISGLESQQVLRYAARALDLAADFGAGNLEGEFLQLLERAPSNVAEIGNGRTVWERLIRPSAVDYRKVVHSFAVRLILDGAARKEVLYGWRLEPESVERFVQDERILLAGTIRAQNQTTWEQRRVHFAELLSGGGELRGFAVPAEEQPAWHQKLAPVRSGAVDPEDWMDELAAVLGTSPLRLQDLPVEDRARVVQSLVAKKLATLDAQLEDFYREHEPLVQTLAECRYELPDEIALAARVALSRRITRVLRESLPDVDSVSLGQVFTWFDLAGKLGIRIELEEPREVMARAARELQVRIEQEWRVDPCVSLIRLLEAARRLRLGLDETELQEWYWFALRSRIESLVSEISDRSGSQRRYVLASALLRLGATLNLNVDDLREPLRPIEEALSRDPDYWP